MSVIFHFSESDNYIFCSVFFFFGGGGWVKIIETKNCIFYLQMLVMQFLLNETMQYFFTIIKLFFTFSFFLYLAIVGPKDTMAIYPKLGDLVIAEIQLNPTSLSTPNSETSQETRGSRLFAHCFAYVERSNIERCQPDNFNNKFCKILTRPRPSILSIILCWLINFKLFRLLLYWIT